MVIFMFLNNALNNWYWLKEFWLSKNLEQEFAGYFFIEYHFTQARVDCNQVSGGQRKSIR